MMEETLEKCISPNSILLQILQSWPSNQANVTGLLVQPWSVAFTSVKYLVKHLRGSYADNKAWEHYVFHRDYMDYLCDVYFSQTHKVITS